MVNPIPATHQGVQFRSRLEGRWALLFDELGIRWLYEPEGFQLASGWYLPDFYLPDLHRWVEVKPPEPAGQRGPCHWENRHDEFVRGLTGGDRFVMTVGDPESEYAWDAEGSSATEYYFGFGSDRERFKKAARKANNHRFW